MTFVLTQLIKGYFIKYQMFKRKALVFHVKKLALARKFVFLIFMYQKYFGFSEKLALTEKLVFFLCKTGIKSLLSR